MERRGGKEGGERGVRVRGKMREGWSEGRRREGEREAGDGRRAAKFLHIDRISNKPS